MIRLPKRCVCTTLQNSVVWISAAYIEDLDQKKLKHSLSIVRTTPLQDAVEVHIYIYIYVKYPSKRELWEGVGSWMVGVFLSNCTVWLCGIF
jgi:hypothetical protein